VSNGESKARAMVDGPASKATYFGSSATTASYENWKTPEHHELDLAGSLAFSRLMALLRLEQRLIRSRDGNRL
jgi:hypothetical protein